MAATESSNADSHRRLDVDAPPIAKDMQGSDDPIPLSPQWLLPKPGESKLGILNREPHSTFHANRSDALRALGNGEDSHDAGKKKDAFQPNLYDSETGRRDRWRDEERGTSSATRRDRWRETERDLGDARKIERWSDNGPRHSGEARRAPSERWADSVGRENNQDQRRESKWNTRWGPDDRESEHWREKWSDSGRDFEGSREKGIPNLTIQGKDMITQGKDADKEGDHYSRSWRSSSSLARGRGETFYHQPFTPNKQAPIFGSGRGKGDNGPPVLSAGRGRVNSNTGIVNTGSSHSYPLGFVSERSGGVHGDSSILRYSRMKLLDIYRTTDLRSLRMSLEGFVEVPSLTIGEPLEPLTFTAPTSEELVILKGIDQGDITSSGVPQVPKDGSTGKNSTDPLTSKQPRLGSRDDSTAIMGDYEDEGSDNVRGKQPSNVESPSYAVRSDDSIKNANEVGTKELSVPEMTSSQYSIPWRSPLAGERSHESSRGCQDFSTESRARTCEFSWLHSQRSSENDQKNDLVSSPYFRDESRWQNSDLNSEMRRDSKIRRQSFEVLDLEKEGTVSHGQGDSFITRDKLSAAKFPPYPSPEELTLFYKDPQGRIQGPFSGGDLIGWFEAGYFGIDLLVRLASAPLDAPFALLGDVMPHLRAKARPPPGFGVAKQNDVAEVSTRGNFNTVPNAHFAIGELEAVKNVQRNSHEVATDAENRFIESLMSGMQGYGLPSVGGESMKDMNYLLAQRMSLETQRSLPTSVSYWPGRDGSPMVSKSDIIPESPSQLAKFLPPSEEVPRQIPPQQVDFLSLLQATADKSTSPAVNSAVPVWPSFPEFQSPNNFFHGGIDIIKDRIDLQQNQHITSQTGFGAQQQGLHQQNQPSLMQILSQPGDLSSAVVPPEKLLAPEISQDPQMINLLQQQYLMSQIQLQSQSQSLLPAHLSLLDKYLLLKQQQQQQQQEQQQQQLLLQQQQHLLSRVLSGHPSHQLFAEPSFGHLKASVPAANTSMDHLGLRHMYESLQNNQQVPILTSLERHAPTTLSPNVQATMDASHTVSTGPSHPILPHEMFGHNIQPKVWDPSHTVSTGPSHPMLPHEMFGHNIQPKEWDPSPQQEPSSHLNSVPQPDLPKSDGLFLSDTMQNNAQEAFIEQESIVEDDKGKQNLAAISYAATVENIVSIPSASIDGLVSAEVAESTEVISSVSEQVDDMKISSDIIQEVSVEEEVGMQEVKKPSEKKSKKQKKPKAQLISDLVKGSSKITDNQPQLKPDCDTERASSGGKKVEIQMKIEPTYSSLPFKTGVEHSVAESLDCPPAQVFSSPTISTDKVNILERKAEHGEDVMSLMSSQATSSNRAWKPAPGLKPKSLLEIQLEEQHRVQRETIVSETSVQVILPSSQTPRVGVANSVNQHDKDFPQISSSTEIAWRSEEHPSISLNNGKSQLHDLLAEEVLAKSNDGDVSFPDEKYSSLDFLPEVSVQAEVSSVDDFVEAKDTKKSRRKAAKAKAAGLKASPPVASASLSTPLIPTERSKSTSQVQQDKELLQVPPVGPSLGDFVFWKGDQANLSPAPAWSSELAKIKNPTSLREIQKEQEKRNPSVQQQIPIPPPAKVQPSQSSQGDGSSWPVPGSSPSKTVSAIQTKVAFPMQTSSHASNQLKSRTEDDLFWGPLDHSKQETKQSDFPFLANPSRRVGKGTPVKGTPGISITRQKPPSGRAADHPISSSPLTGQSFSKGMKDEGFKHSEAMDFRDWCEGELIKLTGSNDTSFLEFCMKQSTSEAEMLLRENLSSLDRNHEFIDKFLNYKDFLAPDVIEIAFQTKNIRKKSGDSLASNNSGTIMVKEADGGGRKGKKGKKVSPAVLGFNVVSNRIMMGEIQTIED